MRRLPLPLLAYVLQDERDGISLRHILIAHWIRPVAESANPGVR